MGENKEQFLNLSKSEKINCGLRYRAVCIPRNFSEPQNPQFIIESGFKSRAGYNGARRVVRHNYIIISSKNI